MSSATPPSASVPAASVTVSEDVAGGRRGPGTVRAVEKALRVLRLFSEDHPQWSLADIARALGLPKSTTFGLLRTLHSCGLLEAAGPGVYRLGMEAIKLGYVARVSLQLPRFVLALMEDVLEKTGQIVYLAVPYDGRVLYVEALYPPKRRVPYSAVGRTAPMHCTALGKAMLAHMDPEQVRDIVRRHGLPRFTENTLTDPDALEAELEQVRRQGYARDRREHDPMVACVAVPVWARNRQLAGALSVSGPFSVFTDAAAAQFAEILIHTSGELTRYIARPIA